MARTGRSRDGVPVAGQRDRRSRSAILKQKRDRGPVDWSANLQTMPIRRGIRWIQPPGVSS